MPARERGKEPIMLGEIMGLPTVSVVFIGIAVVLFAAWGVLKMQKGRAG